MAPHITKSRDVSPNKDIPPPYSPLRNGQGNENESIHIDQKRPAKDANSLIQLSLPEDNSDRNVHTGSCLAHLKLLHAIQTLKENIGYTDGLWGLWDERADYGDNDFDDGIVKGPSAEDMPADERKKLVLSKIREKRWALFVARAVDRYESWWNSFEHDMLTESEMGSPDSLRYIGFTDAGEPMTWVPKMLPPIGKYPQIILSLHTLTSLFCNRCSYGVAFSHAQPTVLS